MAGPMQGRDTKILEGHRQSLHSVHAIATNDPLYGFHVQECFSMATTLNGRMTNQGHSISRHSHLNDIGRSQTRVIRIDH